MKNDITAERIVNSIMQNSSHRGAYLLVEGVIDFHVFNKFKNSSCEIIIAFGNYKIIEAIEIINNRNLKNTVGIIDADFQILDNTVFKKSNLIVTDYHDLEMLIFKSEAFEIFINLHASSEKIEAVKKEYNNTDLREILLKFIEPLGLLKWANKKFELGLVFKAKYEDGKNFKVSKILNSMNLIYIGDDGMIEKVIDYSRDKSDKLSSKDEILAKLNQTRIPNLDLYQLCNGHDLIEVLSLALRKKIGSLNLTLTTIDELIKDLVFSFDSRHFEVTNLYSEIKNWEKKSGYLILSF